MLQDVAARRRDRDRDAQRGHRPRQADAVRQYEAPLNRADGSTPDPGVPNGPLGTPEHSDLMWTDQQTVCNNSPAMDLPQKIDWGEQEFTEVRPGIFGATVHTPQLTATLYRYGGGYELGGAPTPPGPDHAVLEGVDRLRRRRRPRSASSPASSRRCRGARPTPPGSGRGAGAVSLNVFTHREAPPVC